MKIAAIALVLLLALPAGAWSYTDWAIVWEGVVGVERLDDCTERIWYERVFGGSIEMADGQVMHVFVFELSVYNVDHCSGHDGPDVQQLEAQ